MQNPRPHPREPPPLSYSFLTRVLSSVHLISAQAPASTISQGRPFPAHLFGRSGVCTWQQSHGESQAAHWTAGIQEENTEPKNTLSSIFSKALF